MRYQLVGQAVAGHVAAGSSQSQLFPHPAPHAALQTPDSIRHFAAAEAVRRSQDFPHPSPPHPHRHQLAEQGDSQHLVAIATTNLVPLGGAPGAVQVQLSSALRPIHLHLPRCLDLVHQRTHAHMYFVSETQYLLEVTLEVYVRIRGQQEQHKIEYVWRKIVPAPSFQ